MFSRGTLKECILYIKVLIFGLGIFAILYAYTNWLKIPGVVNKSVADASIVLIGISMCLSALSYFFTIFDPLIMYRKHVGLIGFAFGLTHVVLSFSALQRLFTPAVWQSNAFIAPLTGLIATGIFLLMTLISNRTSMTTIGVLRWRAILRTGYLAMILVWIHVVMLKSARWMTWVEGGMKTPPSTSLLVAIFILIVLALRILMEVRLRAKKR